MSKTSQFIRGAKAIAYELGVCDRTLRSMVRKGVLPAAKVGAGGRTSALLVSRDVLDRIREGR